MKTFFTNLQRSKVFGVLALLGLPIGILAYTAFLSPDTTPINQPIGYVAQDEVTNFNLTSGSETLYRPEYKREKWSGNLHAYPLDAAGNINSNERWQGGASEQISAQHWDTGRYIATMNSTGTGVAFRSANLSSLADTINATAYTSADIVNFLRGDLTNAGAGKLRVRASLLGDIVHSRPFFVDVADAATVFVGANDGMLHAINADTGAERWAYVPSMLISKLPKLAYNPDDAAKPFAHDSFVDGLISVDNVTIGGTSKRALFGSLGGGGQGLYALDISTLTAGSEADVASKALWEITPTAIKYNGTSSNSTAYSHLGYTFGKPQVVTIKIGSASQDALLVGNGYDGTANGEAYLYVINASNGALIKAIKVGTVGAANPNGLFNPIGVKNSAGFVDRVYAGDLNGSMWKFDLTSTLASSWPDQTTPLFTTSPAQPITSTPGVASHPDGGYMVTFGTGSTLKGAYGVYDHTSSSWTTAATGELGNSAVHYVYGIWDGAPAANAVLLTQTLAERTYTYAGAATRVRRITANVPDWTAGATHHKGWKVALPAGERVVGEGSFTENGRFYFNSYNPTVAPALVAGTNTDIYGENWLMELNYLTGGSSVTPFLDMNSDLQLNDSDRIVYTGSDTKPSGTATGDPIKSPSADGIPVGKWISTGVQSQPILVQLLTLNTTLLNQNPDVIFPATTSMSRGVAGGHFDVDNFYGANNNCTGVSGAGTIASGGRIDFTYSNNKTVSNFSITINGTQILTANNPGSKSKSNLETWVGANSNSTDYDISINSNRINITAKVTGTVYNASTVNIVVTATGLTSSDYSKTALTGGTNASASLSSVVGTQCDYVKHEHEYDDKYDKTGVNMLNASQSAYNLSNAISSTSTNFKVLMMNQYLSPAVSLHIGDATYNPASPAGYISIKNYQTSASLDLTTVPTYNRNTIGSLAINMPVDAFSIMDWWGSGDARAGLHSVSPGCAWSGTDAGADMYHAVTPPANGTDGQGTAAATTGARHNGVLTVQIIKAATPANAVEENVAGRPEYGYRVKHANFYDYVLVEYIFYWHHPRNMCYSSTASSAWATTNNNGDAWNTVALMTGSGWTKAPPEDNAVSNAGTTPASLSTNPKLGILGSTGTVTSTTTTVAGNITTTTIRFNDGTSTVIVLTANANGTVTIETKQYSSTSVVLSTTTVTVANAAGSVKTGGDERGMVAKTGRISWRELVAP